MFSLKKFKKCFHLRFGSRINAQSSARRINCAFKRAGSFQHLELLRCREQISIFLINSSPNAITIITNWRIMQEILHQLACCLPHLRIRVQPTWAIQIQRLQVFQIRMYIPNTPRVLQLTTTATNLEMSNSGSIGRISDWGKPDVCTRRIFFTWKIWFEKYPFHAERKGMTRRAEKKARS